MTKFYDQKEVKKNCDEYFNGDELASSVVMNKYLLRDNDGNYLESDPEDMLKSRIVKEFARIEKKFPNSISEEEIYDSMRGFKYILPQGSPLFGIGNNLQTVSVGNCFVVGTPFDSYGGIIEKDQQLAQIMKRRGGVGIDISTIRPTGVEVNNSARTSDGITCFMERYSNTTKEVAQNGRRGALMITLDSRHPDLEKFIDIKRNKSKVTGANISVKWHDDIIKAIKNDEEYTLRFPVDSTIEEASFTKTVKVKEIWDKFIESNWLSAEPGCLFWDTVKSQSISDCYAEDGFDTICTNPCGEITLSENGACILQLVNLKSFIDNKFTKDAKLNEELFEAKVRQAVRLTDDLIELEIEKVQKIISKLNSDPEPKEIKRTEINLWKNILDTYKKGRRVGLGVTGLGDMIAYMGYKYGSKESIKFVDEVFKKFHIYTYDESANLARERGSFEVWDWYKEMDSYYIKILPEEVQQKIKKYGRRNIANNTCSPAGSVSMLSQSTSGIEPVFMRSYKRNRKVTQEEIDNKSVEITYEDTDGIKWTSYDVYHKGVKDWTELNEGKDISESPYSDSESGELDWRNRVEIQSTIQRYIDHSISSTCNVSADITQEELSELYLLAHEKKCKGITIYRDGSRVAVLSSKDDNKSKDCITENHAPKRDSVLECDIHYSAIKGDKWIFMVGKIGDVPYEIFGGKQSKVKIPKKYKNGWIKKGREAGRNIYNLVLGTLEDSDEQLIVEDIVHHFSTDTSSYTRIISAMLRHGIPIHIICEQLLKDSESDMYTFEKGTQRVLKKYIKDGQRGGKCNIKGCNGKLLYKDGCVMCDTCGDSKCT
jgi:ribonucleoside-diphosphate reductase alpha chain